MAKLILKSKHRLMIGDSTSQQDVDQLMNGEKADICFTSPPYGLGKNIHLSGNKAMSANSNAYRLHHDDANEWALLMQRWYETSKSAVSSCWVVNIQMLANNKCDLIRFISNHVSNLVDIVVWDKEHGPPNPSRGVLSSRFEWMIIFSNKNEPSRAIPLASWQGTIQNVYVGPPQRSNESFELHGATMPMHVPLWVMGALCDLAKTIYEPFAGTGTTLIAAERLRRSTYCMEIDPVYAAITFDRAEKENLKVIKWQI